MTDILQDIALVYAGSKALDASTDLRDIAASLKRIELRDKEAARKAHMAEVFAGLAEARKRMTPAQAAAYDVECTEMEKRWDNEETAFHAQNSNRFSFWKVVLTLAVFSFTATILAAVWVVLS